LCKGEKKALEKIKTKEHSFQFLNESIEQLYTTQLFKPINAIEKIT